MLGVHKAVEKFKFYLNYLIRDEANRKYQAHPIGFKSNLFSIGMNFDAASIKDAAVN